MFVKGQSGNIGGRPRRSKEEMERWIEGCRGNVDILIEIRDTAKKTSDRLRAIEILEDRAYGKPLQAVEMTGEDGGPVESLVQVELVKPANS